MDIIKNPYQFGDAKEVTKAASTPIEKVAEAVTTVVGAKRRANEYTQALDHIATQKELDRQHELTRLQALNKYAADAHDRGADTKIDAVNGKFELTGRPTGGAGSASKKPTAPKKYTKPHPAGLHLVPRLRQKYVNASPAERREINRKHFYSKMDK